MATEKQLAANGANAKHSTGPKSKIGKTRSSMNSRKHGLAGEAIMIAGEDPAEFGLLHRSLIDDINPRAGAEDELVFRLAGLFWRIARIPVFEAAFLRAQQHEGSGIYRDPRVDKVIELEILRIDLSEKIASTFTGKEKASKDEIAEDTRAKYRELLTPQTDPPLTTESEKQEMLAKIARYETSLMNSISRTLNMLIGLQNMRGERAERRRVIGAGRSASEN